ncbi:hypothetical protein RDWZM_001557 [Blomia tropicalis]|uniref:ABC transporter domain-containing protein n=1 Tax=Blomia tropicalis TaxID=40697 RepID=A0A9Q0MCE2_BLOTA|nr:hypothetical protein RDWZM_001557 [Blomia tropicalis]
MSINEIDANGLQKETVLNVEDNELNTTVNDGTVREQPNNEPVQLNAGNLLNNIRVASARQGSGKEKGQLIPNGEATETNNGSGTKHIVVSWRDLTYSIERSQFTPGNCFTADNGRSMFHKTKRTILKGINGKFLTGHLTAVMGPSGSGKSTMLECIVGFRKRGLSGDIRLSSDTEQPVKVALINQSDYLIESFTVREMLVYASRLKNYDEKNSEEARVEEIVVSNSENNLNSADTSSKGNLLEVEKTKNYHQRLALSVIHQLGLDVCIDTQAGSCSGGQKKRISIALEMISRPNILILDEPTSGLDSSACFQTVSVMERLSKTETHPVAVVCTIHQPSARVFHLFDHVYVISHNGNCIYEGSPSEMLDRLKSVDLHCPQFHNPADYIAEVASGEHGADAIERLIDLKRRQDSTLTEQQGSDKSLSQYSGMQSYPTMLHIWILFQRTTKHILRDPMLNTLRFLSHLMTAIFIGLLYGQTIGKPSLCPPLESPLNDLENFPAYRLKYQEETVTSTENLAFIFFTLMFVMFGSMMPTIMTFPANLSNIRKEKINGWYSVATYYLALSIAEIPFQIIYPIIFCIVAYIMTGQLIETERILYFLLINVITAFVSQSLGLLLGAIFMEDASAAVFLGPISTVPIMLFGGFFVRISTIPWYLRHFSYLSYIRYAFEASLVAVYGLHRCQVDPKC